MVLADEQTRSVTGRRLAVQWLLWCVALLVTGVAVVWIGPSSNHLAHVGLTNDDVVAGSIPSLGWVLSTALLAVGLALWVPLHMDVRAQAFIAQVIGALWALSVMAVIADLMASLPLADRDNSCVRQGCWPQGVQEWLMYGPAGLAAITLLVQVVLPPRWSWRRRALPAVVVLLAGTIVQALIWDDVVVPYLR